MRGWLRALAGSCAFFSLLAACGLDDSVIEGLTGSPDAATNDATFADSPSDTGSDSTMISDASSDVQSADTGVDAAPDSGIDAGVDSGVDAGIDAAVDAGPCPTLTLCDRDASLCGAAQVCVPDIPAGWTLLGFDPAPATGLTACGTSYGATPTTDFTDGGIPTCACSCTAGTAPSCTNVQVVLTTGTGCAAPATTEAVTAACNDLGAVYTVQDSFLEAHLQADPTTCAPSLTTTIPSWDLGSARQCDFTGDAGAFCASHATCVVASGASHTTCIKQAYSGALPPVCGASCPGGFQSACFTSAATLTDGRSCNSCSCGWSDPGCSGATITGSDLPCSGGSADDVSIGADSCDAFTLSSVTALSVTGTAGSPSCGITTAASSSGSVAVSGEEIVCCAN